MATVNIAYFKPRSFADYSVIGPVRTSESITSSGGSSQSTLTSVSNEIARVTVSGGNVHILVGSNPTADTDDMMVISGTSVYVYVPSGEKIAVIDAA